MSVSEDKWGYIDKNGGIWKYTEKAEGCCSGGCTTFLIIFIIAITVICVSIGLLRDHLVETGFLKSRVTLELYETDSDYDFSDVTLILRNIESGEEYISEFDSETVSAKIPKGDYSVCLEHADYRFYWHNITVDGKKNYRISNIPDWIIFWMDNVDLEDEEKKLILLIQTGESDVPDPDITASEITSGKSLEFKVSSEKDGTIYYLSNITEGIWEVYVYDDFDTLDANIEVTEDIKIYCFAAVFGYYEENEETED